MLDSNLSILSPTAEYQLPNAVREAMLQLDHAKGLIVVESLYKLKIKAESWLTFKEIYRYLFNNFNTSYQLVYRGLCDSRIFQRRLAPAKANQKGRRPFLYRVPHPDELIAEFAPNAKYTPTDELHNADLQSVTSYRKALHRELYIRRWIDNSGKGFVMYRGLMADRLGVSARTIRTYDKQLGFSHEANYEEIQITWSNWEQLPRFKDKYAPTGERLPSKSWLKVIDLDNNGFTTAQPLVKFLAYKALTEKKLVVKMTRLANTYYPYQKPDLSRFDSWDALSHYYAEQEARNNAGFFQNQDSTWHHRRE